MEIASRMRQFRFLLSFSATAVINPENCLFNTTKYVKKLNCRKHPHIPRTARIIPQQSDVEKNSTKNF